jgi:NADPH:quinone reductase-like Zn-dependent oxidoreductase
MKAIFFTEYGAADVLRYGEQPTPEPKAGQVLVRVYASSVNPVDWKLRQGDLKFVSGFRFPKIPGRDVAGVVEKLGSNVGPLRAGERVFGMSAGSMGGANAEYALLDVKTTATIPDNLSFEQAAAVPLVTLTALQALRNKGELTEGDRVLINGAAGGVGTMAVQLARLLGAGYVAGTGSATNQELIRKLGADEAINYKVRHFQDERSHYDLIFDAVAHSSYTESKAALRPGGRYVTTVPGPANLLAHAFTEVFSDKKARPMMMHNDGADLHQIREWLADGQLCPIIDRVFPLTETAAAHRYSEEGHVVGKVVLTV